MISVVIPSYNGAETLFQAIDSVLCQTTKTPLEILVIDDNSTDPKAWIIILVIFRIWKMTGYGISGMRQTKERPHPETAVYSSQRAITLPFWTRMITGIPKNWKSRKKPLQRPVMCSAVRVGS